MDIATTSGAGRVRVLEPVPGVPSGAEPLFPGHVRQVTSTITGRLVLSGALLILGLLLVVTDGPESALPYIYFAAFGGTMAMWSYLLVVQRRLVRLFGEPYHRLDVAPDGLLAKGSRVSVRLPDGRWLRTRLTDGARVQLAGERRLWVLGTGERVFVRLPGAMWVRGGRIDDTPVPGSTPAEHVSRHPAPPRHDPVLAAHRRFQIRRMVISGVVFLLLGVAGLVVVSSVSDDTAGFIADSAAVGGLAGGSAVFVFLGTLTLAGLVRAGRPITEDSWLELRVALDTPFVPRARNLARLTGWALHPDGSQTRFRVIADISLAANIATTGQLWLRGYPPPGKPAKAGVPGYPCLGSARLS